VYQERPPADQLAARRSRLASPATATALGVLVLVLLGLTVALSALIHQATFLNIATGVPIPLVYAAVGVVVARHLSIGAIWLSFVGHQVLSWRRATGEQRQQLKWLACGAAVTLSAGVLGNALDSVVAASRLLEVGVTAMPIAIGVGILKYRLYDIDRIISRTLAYAIVTALLAGVYASLVLLATQVFRFHTPVAVPASTLAAAALFNPVRRRVQHAVDRRFNRARYDADQTVTAFAARLKDAVDLDSVRDDLASTVHLALEPAHLSLWVSRRD
jgi:hypothetical protein